MLHGHSRKLWSHGLRERRGAGYFTPKSEYREPRARYWPGVKTEGRWACRMCVGCRMCIGESGGARDQENDGERGISPPKVDTDSNVLSIGLE